MVSWGFLLTKNVHEQDSIFNNTLMIIFFNYTQINLWTLMTRTLHGWLRKQKIKSLKKLNVPVIHFKWQNYYWLPKTTKYWIWNFVNYIKKKKSMTITSSKNLVIIQQVVKYDGPYWKHFTMILKFLSFLPFLWTTRLYQPLDKK